MAELTGGQQVAPTADTQPVSPGDREMRRLVAELHERQKQRGQ